MTDQGLFMFGSYQVRADDLWIIATAACCGVSSGLVGCFLVLRRMSLLGDAISHAILPGLAVAFLITGNREPLPMLIGALGVGVLTAVLSQALHRWGRVPEDASMGVVFTTLFALGVIMITWVARNIDLDPGCVLYGLIEFVPFDTIHVAGLELPRSFVWLAIVLILNTTLIVIFFKELKIVCFDPALATTMGISAALVHYAMMTAVAATSVASFEAVGSIMVVSMLVAPGATAHLLTDRLSRMLWISALIAIASAILGYIGAAWLNTSVAGMIASVSLLIFIVALVLAPRHGVIPKRIRRFALALRICREDILGLLYRAHEQQLPEALPTTHVPPSPTARELIQLTHSGWLGRLVMRLLSHSGLIRIDPGGCVRLALRGIPEASQIVRGHRLWESFLTHRLKMDPSRVHAPAHKAEHVLSDALRSQLEDDLRTTKDPHGRVIP